jgi:hypothetical protein
MHEDDSGGGESLISPAGPSADATPLVDPPDNVTASARQRARPPSGARGLLIYLVVAALAAAAGVAPPARAPPGRRTTPRRSRKR